MLLAKRQQAPPAPQPALIRGICPRCGKLVLSELVYVDGRGYIVTWACVGNESGTCDYRRTL